MNGAGNRALVVLAMLAALAACGSRTRLYPKPGMATVPKAAAASRAQTAEELMRPSTQAQPDRQADLISKSTERAIDPFDLPPGRTNRGGNAAAGSPPPMPDNVAPDAHGPGVGMPAEPTRKDPDSGKQPAPAPDSGAR